MESILFETNRIFIRKLSLNDATLLLKYSQEKLTKRELPDEVFENIRDIKAAIDLFISHYDWEYNHCFPIVYGIVLKENNIIIGHIGLSEIDRGVEVGYAIATEYLDKGYAIEVLSPFVNWAKKHLKIDKIYGITKLENIPSWKVLEKNGFKLLDEGVYRNYFGGKYIVKIYVL
jgi:RimJ/RimL family protein N-acetyltransferase